MKILFLAPQPFYQERGTPIAVRLALEVLSQRPNTTITILTYYEGENVIIPGVLIKRIKKLPFKNIGAGISFKKLACDILFIIQVIVLLWQNRHAQFDLVHAVEESVFVALILKFLLNMPYVYDMDSSLSLQLIEKWKGIKFLLPVMRSLETLAIRNSAAVVPVCYALYQIAEHAGSRTTQIVHDISLLELNKTDNAPKINIKSELALPSNCQIGLYIGNLEKYQGIDLLLKAFVPVKQAHANAHIVIIGGQAEHIKFYKELSQELRIAEQVHFMGPRPLSALKNLLLQADLLLSPRILGNNTPMKIYSYLHSGVPIVATDLPTHTQVLDSGVAFLAEPTPEAFGKALLSAFSSDEERKRVGQAGAQLAIKNYTFEIFQRDLNNLYDRLNITSTTKSKC